jgi:hypothetical protein
MEPPPVTHTLSGHPFVWEVHMDEIRNPVLKDMSDGELIARARKLLKKGIAYVKAEDTWNGLATVGALYAVWYVACDHTRKVGLSYKIFRLLDDLCEEAEVLLWDLDYTPWFRDPSAYPKLFGTPYPRAR